MKSFWTVAALLLFGAFATALAQTPEPGAQATPGQSNPERADPSTATPSAVGPARSLPKAQDNANPSSDTDMANAAQERPKVGREAKLGGLSAGSIVQSPAGENIGRVKDIVPDSKTGDPAYVVIAARNGTAAVPYAVIAPMYQNGHVVLDRARLESAPHVSDSQLRDDKASAEWEKQANRYWTSRNPPSLQ
jgi:sporulation protein YlmC with PRC-barrel domain